MRQPPAAASLQNERSDFGRHSRLQSILEIVAQSERCRKRLVSETRSTSANVWTCPRLDEARWLKPDRSRNSVVDGVPDSESGTAQRNGEEIQVAAVTGETMISENARCGRRHKRPLIGQAAPISQSGQKLRTH
jgi:hypothetical protein